MKHCLLIVALLLLLAAANNDVGLVDWQTNATVGDGNSTSPIVSCNYDGTGNVFMTTLNNRLSFLVRNATDSMFYLNDSITLPQNLNTAKLRGDNAWIAALANSNSVFTANMYLLNQLPGGGYNLTQTFNLTMRANSISWAANGTILLLGLQNQYVLAYKLNGTTGLFYLSQQIQTTHINVTRVVGATSRFATCGTDFAVNLFYYNLTTGLYQFNQTVSLGGFGCSALDFSQNEYRIAVGKPNGNAYILERNADFVYSVQYSVTPAHSLIINAVVLDPSTLYLMTVGADSIVKLWNRHNNYTVAISSKNISGQCVSNFNRQFGIGSFGDKLGTVSFQTIQASNCDGGVSPTNPSACTCINNTYWLNGNCSTLTCSGIPNVIGLSNDNQTCTCIVGTTWDPTLMACRRNCSADDNSNGTNFEYSSCYCNSEYFWNYTLSVCYVNCSIVPNSNHSNVNHSACYCDAGYGWKNQTCTLLVSNCSGTANSNGSNINATACYCNTGFAWNNTAGACYFNCTELANSNGTNINATDCSCKTNYWWNLTAGQCYFNCSNSSNINASSCVCQTNYFWNNSTLSCYLNCSSVGNSTGSNTNATACVCQPGYYWNSAIIGCATTANCTGMPGSNGTNLSPTSCYCNANYTWRASAMLCYFNCSAVSNSNGSNINATTCNCNANYWWNTLANDCYFNCTDMVGSNTSNSDAKSCYCLPGYDWKANGSLCYANCTSQPNSDLTNFNATACNCLANYTWSGGACTLIPVTDCTGMANSNGSNINRTDCACDNRYQWNNTAKLCYLNCSEQGLLNSDVLVCQCRWGSNWNATSMLCEIDCGLVGNANGSHNATACNCKYGYFFSVSACLVGVNCTNMANSNGTNYNRTICNCNSGFYFQRNWLGGISGVCRRDCSTYKHVFITGTPMVPSDCVCALGYAWSSGTMQCVLNCSDMRYSTGFQKDATTCRCKSGYFWDSSSGQCISSSNDYSMALGLGLGIPIGLAALVGLGFGLYYYDKHSQVKETFLPRPSSDGPPVIMESNHLLLGSSSEDNAKPSFPSTINNIPPPPVVVLAPISPTKSGLHELQESVSSPFKKPSGEAGQEIPANRWASRIVDVRESEVRLHT